MALLTKREFDRRWAELRKRYAYQFQRPPMSAEMLPGWLPIAETLFRNVDATLNDVEKKSFVWTQIKEKLGGLRAYFSHDCLRSAIPEESARQSAREIAYNQAKLTQIFDIIEAAEQAAEHTCCFCGAPGERRRGGRILTLCDACARDRKMFADDERAGS